MEVEDDDEYEDDFEDVNLKLFITFSMKMTLKKMTKTLLLHQKFNLKMQMKSI